VRFFEELSGHGVTPLPMDRLHLLLCPPDAAGGGSPRWRRAAADLDVAADLTTVAALPWSRAVLPAGPRTGPPAGAVDQPPTAARLDSPLASARLDSLTVVHAAGDAAAAELAGRLTALAGRGARSVALDTGDVDAALHWRMPGAAVLTLAPDLASPALQRSDLAGRTRWLADAVRDPHSGDSLGAALRALPAGADPLLTRGLVTPLAASRSWLVARGRLAGLALDWDGTLRLAGLGAADQEEALP